VATAPVAVASAAPVPVAAAYVAASPVAAVAAPVAVVAAPAVAIVAPVAAPAAAAPAASTLLAAIETPAPPPVQAPIDDWAASISKKTTDEALLTMFDVAAQIKAVRGVCCCSTLFSPFQVCVQTSLTRSSFVSFSSSEKHRKRRCTAHLI